MQTIAERFEQEMEVIRDETPFMPFREQLALAEARLNEKLMGEVAGIRSNCWGGHQEAVNLVHFG